jgi:hypothetical protein
MLTVLPPQADKTREKPRTTHNTQYFNISKLPGFAFAGIDSTNPPSD